LLEVDLDEMLPRPELDNLNVLHHKRYKLTWPPEKAPSDQLVSRLSKEIDKRLLCLADIWKVRTQAQQQRASRKRKKVGDDVELLIGEQDDDETPGNQDLVLYLANLETAMIGLSIAGIKPASAAVPAEVRGTKSTLIVQVPLDVTMRYYYRAQNKVARMQPSEGLRWLQRKDEDERSIWVDKYRNSQGTLGEIILETMVQRDATWEAERVPRTVSPKPDPAPKRNPNDNERDDTEKRRSKNPKLRGKPKTLAKAFKDGTKLCPAWQRGQCMNKNCNMRHQCAAVMKSGRVCGGKHTPKQCRNPQVVRAGS
jgi:hypothetical protein